MIHHRKKFIKCKNCLEGIDISDVIKEAEKRGKEELFELMKKGELCLNCGEQKPFSNSDMCDKCLEEE